MFAYGPYGLLVLFLGMALGVYFLWRHYRRATFKPGQVDVELEIVLQVAVLSARSRNAPASDADFILAALCNQEVAAVFEDAGFSAAEALRRFEPLATSDASAVEGDSFDPALARAIQFAGATAGLEGSSVTLFGVLHEIQHRLDTPSARLLRARVLLSFLPSHETRRSRAEESASAQHFVYVVNDRRTSMDDVTTLFRTAFGLDERLALYKMLTVHFHGYAALGPFDAPEAQRALERATSQAKALGVAALTIVREAPDTRHGATARRAVCPRSNTSRAVSSNVGAEQGTSPAARTKFRRARYGARS
jgi:ATP-dependent Clp protease adapter protein ClpS